jgi:hypothetical protein
MADMTARINSLERSLVGVAAKKTIVSERKRPKRKSTPEASDCGESTPSTHPSLFDEATPREDGLVHQGSSSQYFNEYFLSKVLREVSIRQWAHRMQLEIANMYCRRRAWNPS